MDLTSRSLLVRAAQVAVGGAAVALVDGLVLNGAIRNVVTAPFARPSQTWFVVKHWQKPWLAGVLLDAERGAIAAQQDLFGSRGVVDGGQDAFRHAYAAGLVVLACQRDHGLSRDQARRIALEAGEAHERDAPNDENARRMDGRNNELGGALVGDGRSGNGQWLTDGELRRRVVDALSGGRLVVVDHTVPGAGALRATSSADMHPAAAVAPAP